MPPDRTRKSPFPEANPLAVSAWSSGRRSPHRATSRPAPPLESCRTSRPQRKESRTRNPAAAGASPASTFWGCSPRSFPRFLHEVASAVIPLRCAACDAVLEWQEGEWCGPCAFSLRRNLAQAQHRFAGRLDHARGWSWWAPGKEGGERRAVHRLKYGGRASLGRALGQAMAEEAPVALWPNPENGRLSPFPCTAGSNVDGGTTKVNCSLKGGAP